MYTQTKFMRDSHSNHITMGIYISSHYTDVYSFIDTTHNNNKVSRKHYEFQQFQTQLQPSQTRVYPQSESKLCKLHTHTHSNYRV